MSSANRGGQPRRGRGRQRVNMARMENENNLQVTFSKRRAGLFKKASELCILCGVDVGIIVFSPSDKAFSFGHPNIQTICDRFLSQPNTPPPPNPVEQLIEANRNSNIIQRNLELTNNDGTVEFLKKSGKERDENKLVGQTQQWFPPSFDSLNFHQLQDWFGRYTYMKNMAENLMQATNPAMDPYFPSPDGTNPSFGGSPLYGGQTFGFPGLPTTHMAGPNIGTATSLVVHGSTVQSSFFTEGASGYITGAVPHYSVGSSSNVMAPYDSSNPSTYTVPPGASGGSTAITVAAPNVPTVVGSVFPPYGMGISSRATTLYDPRNPSPAEGGETSGSNAAVAYESTATRTSAGLNLSRGFNTDYGGGSF